VHTGQAPVGRVEAFLLHRPTVTAPNQG
jgi:hypothetical protein